MLIITPDKEIRKMSEEFGVGSYTPKCKYCTRICMLQILKIYWFFAILFSYDFLQFIFLSFKSLYSTCVLFLFYFIILLIIISLNYSHNKFYYHRWRNIKWWIFFTIWGWFRYFALSRINFISHWDRTVSPPFRISVRRF